MGSQNEKSRHSQTGGNGAKKAQNKLLGVIGAAAAILLVIGSFVVNSNFFYSGTPAIKIGDTDYTVAEFNFYYFEAYSQFFDTYGDTASLLVDTSLPLDEQEISEGVTFHDMFVDEAISSMKEVQALYNAAPDKTLTEEQSLQVENEIATIAMYAPISGMTEEQFLTTNYGKGFTTDTLREVLTRNVIASGYQTTLIESYTYTDEELSAEYEANKNDTSIIEYRSYYVANGEDKEEAHATADAIAEATDGDEFAELVLEKAPEEDKASFTENEATLTLTLGESLAAYDFGSWLTDPAREEFETTVVESSTGDGYFVVMFISRDDNNYNTRNVRHILINPETDAETGLITEEAKADALAEAERILAEFEAGDMTEDSFAALANQYSQDGGSNTNGGLYENVAKNQMVPNFEEFLFAATESGETGIVLNEGSYTGYHIMYYVGEGDLYSHMIAEASLRQTAFTEWMTAETAKIENVTTEFAFRFAG